MTPVSQVSQLEISGFPRKDERIRIRCDRDVKVEFKKIAAEIGTYEETLKLLMDLYKKWGRARIGPQIR